MKRPFFSMILPLHNGSKTLDRALNSLTEEHQNIVKDDLQLIIVNDNSKDDYTSIINDFNDRLCIEVVNTKERDMHCPGNTRFDGMEYVKGKWLCFLDQDDLLEDNALKYVKSIIISYNEQLCLATNMRSWNENNDAYTEFCHKSTWLHGKFYNVDNLIKKYNINFKENLYSHEDVYFNCRVMNELLKLGRNDFMWADMFTYRWVENPTSITRSYDGEFIHYVEEHFEDYLYATTEPFMQSAIITRTLGMDGPYTRQVLFGILFGYFYHNAALYRIGDTESEHVRVTCKDLICKVIDLLNMSIDEIIQIIYSNPKEYHLTKLESVQTSNEFIEVISFRDWIYKLYNDEKIEWSNYNHS